MCAVAELLESGRLELWEVGSSGAYREPARHGAGAGLGSGRRVGQLVRHGSEPQHAIREVSGGCADWLRQVVALARESWQWSFTGVGRRGAERDVGQAVLTGRGRLGHFSLSDAAPVRGCMHLVAEGPTLRIDLVGDRGGGGCWPWGSNMRLKQPNKCSLGQESHRIPSLESRGNPTVSRF